jgi:hypothetical protein
MECTKCQEVKELTEFYVRKDAKKGYTSHCKVCIQARHHAKEFEAPQDGVKVCTRCNTEKHVTEFGNMVHAYDGLKPHCKACHANVQLEYVDKNREAVNSRHRSNNVQHAARARKRRATDPAFKLRQNLASRILHALKNQQKSASTMNLVGCSLEDLKKHLESKFTEGMTWDNHGQWHIDHIRPCASFDLTKPEQQKECFHWSNLQPLWALDNLRKNSRWEGSTVRVRPRPGHSTPDTPH